MNKRILGVLIGLACAAVLAACGGDGDGGETTAAETQAEAEPLTKAEFIAAGDRICVAGEREAEVEAEAFAEEEGVESAELTQEQVEEAVEIAFVPSLQKQAEEIGALGAPAGEEADVEAIVAALETAADELESDPALLFDETANPLTEASQLAAEFGFEECGG